MKRSTEKGAEKTPSGGRAAERLKQFERERGIGSPLPLSKAKKSATKKAPAKKSPQARRSKTR